MDAELSARNSTLIWVSDQFLCLVNDEKRTFLLTAFVKLDAVDEDRGPKASDVDFETLLRAVQAQLHRRPCS